MSEKWFYRLLLGGCSLGMIWLVYSFYFEQSPSAFLPEHVCFFRSVTGLPCPACGSTRALHSFIQGDWLHALWHNPLGLFWGILLLILPFWLIYDAITHQHSLYRFYLKSELTLQQKPTLAIAFGISIVGIWCWNIIKML